MSSGPREASSEAENWERDWGVLSPHTGDTWAQRPTQAWGSRAWEKKTDCFAVYDFNDRRMTSSFLMVCRAPSISFILQKRWVISWAPRKQFRVKTHWKSLRWIPCAWTVLSSCTICSITALFVNAEKRTDNRLVTQRFFSPWRSVAWRNKEQLLTTRW